ncbi:MAG: prepilin-type N-terminal cleavage/methylation domain-containing protein [Cyanobacteria bacterium SIG27]|nr:prepilin-type N-terminal cleavage/methylation domain-containing protein [Cyanobacteria bacterium SIG27]
MAKVFIFVMPYFLKAYLLCFMEVKMNRNKLAFSLVEILVALIIISVIMAALAPTITKKVSSSAVVVGASSTVGGTPVTPSPPDDSELVCPQGSYAHQVEGTESAICRLCSFKTANCLTCDSGTGICLSCEEGYNLDEGYQCEKDSPCGELAMKISYDGEDYCVTKYNIGDGGLDIPSGSVTIAHAGYARDGGTNCTSSCCWIADINTSSFTCDSGYSHYNACTRTVCNEAGATSVCSNLSYNGYDDWVLPPVGLFSSLDLSKYSLNQGSDGLMLCDKYADYVSPQCGAGCCWGGTGGGSDACNPSQIWTSSTAYEAGTAYRAGVELTGGTIVTYARNKNWALSVRCARKMGTFTCPEGSFGSTTEKSCSPCNSKTEGCELCHYSTGLCTKCYDGLTLTDDKQCKRESDCGEKALKVDYSGSSYCITKYNIGDAGLTIPKSSTNIALAGMTVQNGTQCTADACCWVTTLNPTSTTCDSGYSYYSPCTRTVCTGAGAKALCENLTYNGYDDWVLPTAEILKSLDLNSYSLNQGSDGLMLCDAQAGYISPQCANNGCCWGALSDQCNPHQIWTSSIAYESGTAYNAGVWLNAGVLASGARNNRWALSVRCMKAL